MAKATTGKSMTKSEILAFLAEETNMTKKDVQAFLNATMSLIKRELGKKGPGILNLAGLMKIKRVEKKAVPAGERKDPFTGQMKFFKAKPARNSVRVLPLKTLKQMV